MVNPKFLMMTKRQRLSVKTKNVLIFCIFQKCAEDDNTIENPQCTMLEASYCLASLHTELLAIAGISNNGYSMSVHCESNLKG